MPDVRKTIEALSKRVQEGDPLARAALKEFLRRQYATRIAMARKDVNVFLPMVLRDEETGKRIRMATYHRDMQELISQYNRVVIWGHVECGKSQAISIGRTLWEIGQNQRLRVVIIQSTQEQAKSVVASVKRYIERSPDYQAIFPAVERDPDGIWTKTKMTIKRPTSDGSDPKDPTVQAVGVNGISSVLGQRIDLLIMDDVITQDNVLTEAQRQGVYNKIKKTLLGRMTANGRIVLIGNAWHPEDAMHIFAKPRSQGGDGWANQKFPVRDPITGLTNWPERWPQERIEAKVLDYGGEGHPEAARNLDCEARSDEAAKFKDSWVQIAKDNGRGILGGATQIQRISEWPLIRDDINLRKKDPEVYKQTVGRARALAQLVAEQSMQGTLRTFTGVDLAVSKSAGADLTALFHLMLLPDDRILVLAVEAGKWDAMEILTRIYDAQERYRSKVIVENNAAQEHLRQFANDPRIAAAFGRKAAERLPVYPFRTRGKGGVGNKHHKQYGVESIGAEMATGKWIIPCTMEYETHPQIRAWIQDMRFYSPTEHLGDRLSACWMAHNGARRRAGTYRFSDKDPSDLPKDVLDPTPRLEGDTAQRRSAYEQQALDIQKKSAWDL